MRWPLVLLLTCAFAAPALAATPGGPNWIVDPDKGCGTSNPFPNPDDRIKWDGACRNGMLHGPGTLIWLQKGEEYERDEGNFVDGELDGPAVIRFPDGGRVHGNYRAGTRDGAFTVVRPDGTHVRATYRDGELAGEYEMSAREIEAWEAERAAAPPPPPPVTEVTGKGDRISTTTTTAAPSVPPPAPPAVDTGRPPRLGQARPTTSAPKPPAAPPVASVVASPPATTQTGRPPRLAAAPPPPPPAPAPTPPAASVDRAPLPALPDRPATPSIVQRTPASPPPPPIIATAPLAPRQPAPAAVSTVVAPPPSPPIQPQPRRALPPLPTPPLPAPPPATPPLAAPAPTPTATPPRWLNMAALPRPAPEGRVGAVPIYGGGRLTLRPPGSDTTVIGSNGAVLPPAPASGGIQLRPPVVAPAAPRTPALGDDLPAGRFTIDLRGASVQDAAAAVFGGLLGRPYSVAPGLSLPITLAPQRPVDAGELLVAFRQQLNAAGADLRRTSDGYEIVRY